MCRENPHEKILKNTLGGGGVGGGCIPPPPLVRPRDKSGMFIVANHKQDLWPQKTKKSVAFPSDMEHICSVSNLLTKPLIPLTHVQEIKLDITAATGY